MCACQRAMKVQKEYRCTNDSSSSTDSDKMKRRKKEKIKGSLQCANVPSKTQGEKNAPNLK